MLDPKLTMQNFEGQDAEIARLKSELAKKSQEATYEYSRAEVAEDKLRTAEAEVERIQNGCAAIHEADAKEIMDLKAEVERLKAEDEIAKADVACLKADLKGARFEMREQQKDKDQLSISIVGLQEKLRVAGELLAQCRGRTLLPEWLRNDIDKHLSKK